MATYKTKNELIHLLNLDYKSKQNPLATTQLLKWFSAFSWPEL